MAQAGIWAIPMPTDFPTSPQTGPHDVEIALDNRPGSLAEMGEALGRAAVSIEGGGSFVVNGQGVAHFLVADGNAARTALEAAGISVVAIREVVIQRLDQATPGQLGKLSRRMADSGVNIEVLYSDHEHRLILVVDDPAKARAVAQAWMHEHDAASILSAKPQLTENGANKEFRSKR